MTKKMSFEDFKQLLEDRVTVANTTSFQRYGFDWEETLISGDDEVGIEHIESEGGGEGGSEDVYTVLKIDDIFYRIDYNYYSFEGYSFDCAEVKIVTPKKKAVIVYE